MSTTVVEPMHLPRPRRIILNLKERLKGLAILDVVRVTLRIDGENNGLGKFDMYLVKLGNNLYISTRSGDRFKVKVLKGNKINALYNIGTNPVKGAHYVYEINEVESILTIGKDIECTQS